MALVPSLSKSLASSRGALGKILDLGIAGLGGGAVVNVADKEIFHGKMTSIGYTLPFTLPMTSSPLRFNLTDVAFFWLINGLKVPKGKSALWTLAKLGLKKVAESKNWIDPPTPAGWGTAGPSNDQGSPDLSASLMPTYGGLTHS